MRVIRWLRHGGLLRGSTNDIFRVLVVVDHVIGVIATVGNRTAIGAAEVPHAIDIFVYFVTALHVTRWDCQGPPFTLL